MQTTENREIKKLDKRMAKLTAEINAIQSMRQALEEAEQDKKELVKFIERQLIKLNEYGIK